MGIHVRGGHPVRLEQLVQHLVGVVRLGRCDAAAAVSSTSPCPGSSFLSTTLFRRVPLASHCSLLLVVVALSSRLSQEEVVEWLDVRRVVAVAEVVIPPGLVETPGLNVFQPAQVPKPGWEKEGQARRGWGGEGRKSLKCPSLASFSERMT